MKKFNIVFLDFDGVFNGIELRDWKNNRYSLDKELNGILSKNIPNYKNEWQHFDMDIFYSKIKIFINALKDIPDIKIVLSTSWRNMYPVHHFERVFKCIPGWTFDIIGKTGRDEHHKRGNEIENWINLNKSIVNNYVIVDDETIDMLPTQKHKIVKTSVNFGICKKDGYMIQSFLQKYDIDGNIINRRKQDVREIKKPRPHNRNKS